MTNLACCWHSVYRVPTHISFSPGCVSVHHSMWCSIADCSSILLSLVLSFGGGVGARLGVAVVLIAGPVGWGAMFGAEAGVAAGAEAAGEAGSDFGVGAACGGLSIGVDLLFMVFLVSERLPLLLSEGGWDEGVGAGLGLLLVLLFNVSGLKKIWVVFLVSWLSSSRANSNMAFLSNFRIGVGVGMPMREKARLISWEWKIGLNSTQVNNPFSSFCAMVVLVTRCWRAMNRRCRRR